MFQTSNLKLNHEKEETKKESKVQKVLQHNLVLSTIPRLLQSNLNRNLQVQELLSQTVNQEFSGTTMFLSL